MSDDRTITDDERTDSNEVNSAGVAKRLGKVVKILTRANKRLDLLSAVGAIPPDDNTPTIVANADLVIGLANDAIAEANQIKQNAGGVVGGPG